MVTILLILFGCFSLYTSVGLQAITFGKNIINSCKEAGAHIRGRDIPLLRRPKNNRHGSQLNLTKETL